jgi:hypothetical protein
MLSLLLTQAAVAAPGGWAVVPFGVGVYLHGKPARGAVYTATQAAGIGVLTWGTVNGFTAAENEDETEFAKWQGVTVAGATVTALSYLVSVVDASRLHEIEMGNEEKERVMRWDEARFSATLSVRP